MNMIEIEDISFENFLDENFSIVTDDSTETKEEKSQNIFPILPVRNMVMFPKVVIPITAGREKSIKLLEAVSYTHLDVYKRQLLHLLHLLD